MIGEDVVVQGTVVGFDDESGKVEVEFCMSWGQPWVLRQGGKYAAIVPVNLDDVSRIEHAGDAAYG